MQDVSYLCPECHKKEHLKNSAPKISDIRLQQSIEPKQPKPKARRKKGGKKKKYALSQKERKFLSKFKK